MGLAAAAALTASCRVSEAEDRLTGPEMSGRDDTDRARAKALRALLAPLARNSTSGWQTVGMVNPVRVVRAAELLAADPTPGMARERAYELPEVWAGRVVTAPGSFSGWHHHDSNTSSLYVVSGVLRFEFEGYDGYLDAEAGDFVHVPPYTVHRESNPTSEPSVAVIARFGDGTPTVNVDAP